MSSAGWCKDNRLSPSVSRRGSRWDNAFAESFYNNLKSEKIKRKIYKTRQEAKSEVVEYIEDFYNTTQYRKHLDKLSPVEFERCQIALWRVYVKFGACLSQAYNYGGAGMSPPKTLAKTKK